VALLILEDFPVEWVRISLNKPGAIRNSRDVGVVIERTRADLPAADAARGPGGS
jgi:dihydroneopterin aldolase